MTEVVEISLGMPAELGALVVARDTVQTTLKVNRGVRIVPTARERDVGGAFRDFGATALAILGTAAASAAVKGIFDVIKTAVIEAHKTRRQLYSERHEFRKLVLVLGHSKTEINLDDSLQQIERMLNELEEETVQRLQPA